MSGLKVKVLEAPIFDGVAQDLVLKSNNVNRIVIANTGPVSIQSNLSYSGTLTGNTGIINIGSGQFYKDASGNVGIGTTTPSVYGGFTTLEVGNTSGNAGLFSAKHANGNAIMYNAGGIASFGSTGAYSTTFISESVERMRINSSGNVGIGTASPQAKLDINGSDGISNRSLKIKPSANGADIPNLRTVFIEHASNDGALSLGFSTSTDAWVISSTYGSTGAYKPLVFATSDSERMRIDSTGNVGIGVTPSAWDVGFNVVEGPGGSFFSGSSQTTRIIQNGYYSTNYKYKISSVGSTLYEMTNGSFKWWNAPSGTAGNAISFTQAMTLNASGQLGIGFTSPDQPLAFADSLGTKIQFNGSNANGYQVGLASAVASGDAMMKFTAGETASGEFGFYNTTNLRMLIDPSGNLLVGQTSWSFSNNGTQIAANGRIYNTSNTDYNFELAGSTTARMRFYSSAGGSGTTVGTITVSGSATTYATSSDYRLKENVAPMTGALATVAALKPVTYKWKADGSDGQGFIAHELQSIVPDAVTGAKNAVDADGKPQYQGVDTSFLVATLTAAIQELTARLEVLENKFPNA